jgi:hypothetical protein
VILIESTSFDILNLALAELHPAAAVAVAVSLRERFSGKRSVRANAAASADNLFQDIANSPRANSVLASFPNGEAENAAERAGRESDRRASPEARCRCTHAGKRKQLCVAPPGSAARTSVLLLKNGRSAAPSVHEYTA